MDVIQRFLLNQSLNIPELIALRTVYAYPSLKTCERYIQQWHALGHCRPMRPTGNHVALREVRGQDVINLALFRSVLPAAPIDQLRALLHHMNPVGIPFGQQAIRAKHLLNLSRKDLRQHLSKGLPANK